MFKKKKILAIIPARSGSKGIKNKNLKKINNISLVGHAIECLKKIKEIDYIHISTDGKKTYNEAKKYNLKPNDETLQIMSRADELRDAVRAIKSGFSAIVSLIFQPSGKKSLTEPALIFLSAVAEYLAVEILELAEIDLDFARGRIPEFVMYWKDSQQVKSSWNTVFLQYVKQNWANQLKQRGSSKIAYAENQSVVGSSQQKIKERFQQITDRSWAE